MRDLERTFTSAFEQYSDELFRHCSMRIADRERALELTQEAFLRSWDYAQRGGEEIREWRPFLYRTLRHLIIDEYRKRKSSSLEAMAEAGDASPEDLLPPDESNTLERAVERFEGKRALAALEQLPDIYREALSLRYVEGMTPQEIAHILEESENVVSVRIHRGLKKLRDILEPATAPNTQV